MPVEPVVMHPKRPLPGWQLRAWELLAPRVPRPVARWIGDLFLRLPPGSRARRWFLQGLAVIGWEVTARTRADLVLPIWDPACEWHWDHTFQTLGFDEVYRGHDGVRRSLEQFNEVFTERSYTVREVLDGGEAIVLRVTIAGRGARGGVPTEMSVSSVVRLKPFIVDYRTFAHDSDALRDAGFTAVAQVA